MEEYISLKPYEPLIGLSVLTLTGGLTIWAIRKYISTPSSTPPNTTNNQYQHAVHTATDELYSVRYALLEKITHIGSCHCKRCQFRVRAPRTINAFDAQSKIRYPRMVIKGEDFYNLSDEKLLSLYAVTNGNSIGIHAFCSFCGVHILYSPSEDPKEVHINVDCLDPSTISAINVSYYGSFDTVPCSVTDTRARRYSRGGLGSWRSPAGGFGAASVVSNLSDTESLYEDDLLSPTHHLARLCDDCATDGSLQDLTSLEEDDDEESGWESRSTHGRAQRVGSDWGNYVRETDSPATLHRLRSHLRRHLPRTRTRQPLSQHSSTRKK